MSQLRKQLLSEDLTPHRSNKDTKKWCKGKPGVPHDYEWHPWAALKGWNLNSKGYIDGFYIQVCNNCGRHGKMENRNSVADLQYYKT